MKTQNLSYNVAVCGSVVASFPEGAAGLGEAEKKAQEVAATLTPVAEWQGEKFEQVVTVDQMVNGEYFGEASRFVGSKAK